MLYIQLRMNSITCKFVPKGLISSTMFSSLFHIIPALLLFHTWHSEYAEGRLLTDHDIRAEQTEAVKNWSTHPRSQRCPTSPHNNVVKNVTFSNPRASGALVFWYVCIPQVIEIICAEFYVDGTTIPEVDFDVGPSWSGLLPISGDPNETRKVSRCWIGVIHWIYDLICLTAVLLVLSSRTSRQRRRSNILVRIRLSLLPEWGNSFLHPILFKGQMEVPGVHLWKVCYKRMGYDSFKVYQFQSSLVSLSLSRGDSDRPNQHRINIAGPISPTSFILSSQSELGTRKAPQMLR